MHYSLLLKIFLAALVAGALDSFVGFAGAFLLLPALTLILGGSLEAVVLSSVISFGWNATRLIALRQLVDVRTTGLIAIGILPGAFVGVQLFSGFDAQTLRTAIAVVLVVCGAYYILRLYVDVPESGGWVRKWMFPVIGFFSGGLSAAIGAGNGPIHAVALRSNVVKPTPQKIAATTAALGCITAMIRVAGYGSKELFVNDMWLYGGVGFLGAVVGSAIAVKAHRRTQDATLELVTALVIVLAGVRLLF